MPSFRMQKLVIALGTLLCLLAASALTPSATLAATLTMISNHDLTASLAPAGGGALSYDYGLIHSSVDGRSWHNPTVQTIDNDSLEIPPSGTVASSLPATTWLTTTSATMTFNGGNSFTAQNHLSGLAPSPSATNTADGYLNQYGQPFFYLYYTLLDNGNYVANVTDLCNLNFLVQNNTTGGNYFYSSAAFSKITIRVTVSGSEAGRSDIYQLPESGFRREGPTETPVAFDPVVLFNQSGQTSVNFTGYGGQNVILEVYVKDYYYGWTNNTNPVPAPASLLLLGSGLLGLGLLGCRRKRG
jgi:hypothetical protein